MSGYPQLDLEQARPHDRFGVCFQRKAFLRMTGLFSEIYVIRGISGLTYKRGERVNLTADSTVL